MENQTTTDELGYTERDRYLRSKGAVWHNGSDVVKQGWYYPHNFGGLPLTETDRKIADATPFGTYLSSDTEEALRILHDLL